MVGLCVCAGKVDAQNTRSRILSSAPAAASDSKDTGKIASYGIGLNTGRTIKSEGVDIDLEAFLQGIRDGIEATPAKYTDEQIRAALTAFQREMQAKQQQRQELLADKNQRAGKAFLAENKTKPGVKALPSGLQYQVVRAGKGTSPKASDTVTVHYEGTLLDGTVFDSSIKRKEPATFPVGGVIPGWTEALQLMKVGDKWRLFVPPELAYGAQGAGRVIGPNSVLIFDVELLDIGSAPREILPGGSRRQE
jgi:FKBP-type peptidyl-prolyl cis-trans isomerase FklB